MSLPPEILDLIVDHLHNEPIALKACCVVSKSWVPRSRRFIFARVEFDSVRSSIGLWTKAFPDPPNSPAHFTRSLRIHSLGVVSANVCTWIRSFFHIEELVVNTFGWGGPYGISPVQLHGLSPTLKSLHLSRVSTPISEILDLICSFPLLEDLSLHSEAPESHTERWTTPPISPKLTGSLLLNGENRSIIRGLLGLPDGLRFSSIRVGCYVDDADSKMITELISKCSDTLESLYIGYYPLEVYAAPGLLDLSNARKLKCLEFRWGGPEIRWITRTLQTAQPKILRQITILLYSIPVITTEQVSREWGELDRLLVQLWTSHSIHPRILHKSGPAMLAPRLLPELMRRGFVRNCDKGMER